MFSYSSKGNFTNKIQSKSKVKNVNKSLYGKEIVDNYVKEISLHPVLLNPTIETILTESAKEKILHTLDPDVYSLTSKSSDDDEDDNQMISKLFETDDSNKKQFLKFSSTSLFSLKENKKEKDLKINQKITEKIEQIPKVYTSAHFKWLFDQGKNHKLNKNAKLGEDKSEKNLKNKKGSNLEKKIKEFCEWAELKYDCKELELDAITLMKIFLVNYDKGPLMWAPIHLQQLDRKNFKNFVANNFSSDSDTGSEHSSTQIKLETNDDINDDFNHFLNVLSGKKEEIINKKVFRRNNYGKWYLPKKYWLRKALNKDLGDPRSDKAIDEDEKSKKGKRNTKLLKYNGVKLFSEYFIKNKDGKIPYFLENNQFNAGKALKKFRKFSKKV
ncbi:unnamed protein product [Brachionus calyciflorus]|uniref:Uncharacterized protein n=1 Tax=Brachionus calyciflorus TaxID=104777 RepID=A0A814GW90_9BILA|nr:unnamed protein product [Brachionus calyciflorus]